MLAGFKEGVFCYPPGDFVSLMGLVATLAGLPEATKDRRVHDNYDQYIASLDAIYSKVIK
ncbi:hypothetical protein D3C75_1345720 [compost metagenome]